MKSYAVATVLLTCIIGFAALGTMTGDSRAQDAGGRRRRLEARVDGTVREGGVLESASTVELSCGVHGGSTIVSIVSDGARVKKGDVVVTLDDSAIHEKLLQQQIENVKTQAAVKQAERRLEQSQVEQADSIATAESAVELATLSRDYALGDGGELDLQLRAEKREITLLEKKIDYLEERSKNPVRGDANTNLQLTLSLFDLQTQLENARGKQAHLTTHVRPLAERTHKLEVDSASRELRLKKIQLASGVEQAQAELDTRRIAAEIEQGKLADLQQQKDACRIRAPRDGMIVYYTVSSRRAGPVVIEEGAPVREKQVLMVMPDLEHLQVRLHVHESKITRVRRGQTATVRFDALPEETWTGPVTSVSTVPLPGIWPNVDAKNFEVIVTLKKPDPRLRLGMTCLAEIEVGE